MTRSTPEDERILHYFDESPSPDYRRRLLADPAEREEYERLAEDLDRIRAADPARPGSAEPPSGDAARAERLWSALAPRLRAEAAAAPARRRRRRARWAAAAAVAAALVLAFLAGTRFGGGAGETIPAEARQRLLQAMVDEHLRRSERLLADLVHGDPTSADWGPERERAARLASETRLYRGTLGEAAATPRLGALLDDLERVLAEVANAPADSGAAQRVEIRRRIQRLGLRTRLKLHEVDPRDRV